MRAILYIDYMKFTFGFGSISSCFSFLALEILLCTLGESVDDTLIAVDKVAMFLSTLLKSTFLVLLAALLFVGLAHLCSKLLRTNVLRSVMIFHFVCIAFLGLACIGTILDL